MSAQGFVLSGRMKHVLELVSVHAAAADVGCDHGYLAMELIRSGKAGHVIAMDINRGPLARAKENLRTYGFFDLVETRLSDGMEALKPGEVQCVICAGMGGKTICGVLDRSLLFAQQLEELVLQPQSELHMVRSYLRTHGFRIAAEDMAEEDGKFYPMMRVIPAGNAPACRSEAGGKDAEKAKGKDTGKTGSGTEERYCAENAARMQRLEDRYGPCLIAEAHPVLYRYLQKEKAVCVSVLEKLSASWSGKSLLRREELAEQLDDIAFAMQVMSRRTEMGETG